MKTRPVTQQIYFTYDAYASAVCAVFVSVCPSVRLSVCPSVSPSVRPSVRSRHCIYQNG